MKTIGKLAKELGLGVETIRFYEREGLIKQPQKPQNGYRVYDDSITKQLQFICKAKAVVFRILCHFVKLSKKEMTYDQNQFRHGCRFKAVA